MFAVCDFGFSEVLIFCFVAEEVEENMNRYKFECYSFDGCVGVLLYMWGQLALPSY